MKNIEALNSFIIILIIGSLFLLSFLLLSNILRVNRKANIFFGVFLLLWGSFWTEELLSLLELKIPSIFVFNTIKTIQSFTAIVFYTSVLYFTNPFWKLRIKDILHLVVPVVMGANFSLNASNGFILNQHQIFVILLLLQAFIYIFWSLFLLRKHEKQIELFRSNREIVDLKWIKQTIYGLIAISIFIIGYNLAITEGNLNIYGNIFSLTILQFLAYNILKQKEIYLLPQEELEKVLQDERTVEKLKQKLLSDSQVSSLKNKLEFIMTDKKPYLEGDLSLSKLAKLVEITPHHLSYLLNEGFSKNFFQFVNHYRVEEAKKLLVSKDYENFSIVGIAYESGFNSKTAFNTVFKKLTGMTPTAYKNSRSH
ncbi:helix-turn-helix domain-containing protein [Prolixibacteraceae bacterium JC049]|nr:helix-turn-helix domain-containing protein [Prolixibacteraceae bacterium JC049]